MKSKQNILIISAMIAVIVLSMVAVGIYRPSPAKEADLSAENSGVVAFEPDKNGVGADELKNDQAADTPGSCSSLGQLIKESTEPGPPRADLNSCCAGLTPTYPLEDFDKDCTNTYLERGPSGPTNYLCLSCGDGICDSKYENKCNCPEDCK